MLAAKAPGKVSRASLRDSLKDKTSVPGLFRMVMAMASAPVVPEQLFLWAS